MLRGEVTPWKITSIKIKHHYMWMTLYNEELYRRYHEEDTETQEDDLPYYSECIEFGWGGKDGQFAQLRFELEDPKNTDAEAILVYFSNNDQTHITELSDNKRREIFLPGQEVSISNRNYCLINVTEHYR